MAIALVASTVVQGVAVTSITTPAINTTGASLLLLLGAIFSPGLFSTSSDSKANTWATEAGPVAQTSSGDDTSILRSVRNPGSVGASHTATLTLTGADYPTPVFVAFSGTDTTSAPRDAQTTSESSGALTHATATATGSATDLAVAQMAVHGGGSLTVSAASLADGWVQLQDEEGGAGENIITAYKLNCGASTSCTFNTGNSVAVSTIISTWKEAGGGGASRPVKMAGAWGGFAGAGGGFAG